MPTQPAENPRMFETLTLRERQILAHLADGKSDRAIAAELFLSVNTVKWYARQIYAKLGVESRQDAVQMARQLGLLDRPPEEPPRAPLPTFLTPFVGRSQELDAIHHLLQDENYRLVTLVGPGGMGKTRLAIEAARRSESFAGRAFFVDLLPVATAELLVPAIADAVGIQLAGHAPLPVQLLRYLRDKRLLLLLDGFEHLGRATHFLVDILHHAPGIKLLVTSRTALGVREEWLYTVDGLAVPPPGASQDPARWGALQLFDTRARQVRHDFVLADELEAVSAICRRVGGSPLAVELAASWAAVLDCATIAAQLQQSLNILTTNLSNMPARHRSLRAVIDHSWQMLRDEERAAFCRLTLFHSPFTYDAAQTVAATDPPLLAALVAKSLVRRLSGGRYQLHELLRQYGIEQLAADPAHAAAAHQSYCDYYLNLLAARRFSFDGHEQIQAVQEIAAELESIRHAWNWAIRHAPVTSIQPALRSLFFFHQHRSRYLEGVDLFAETSRRLEQRTPTAPAARPNHDAVLAESLTYYGWLCIRLSRLAESAAALARAQELYAAHGLAPPHYRAGDPLTAQSILALVDGDYAQAARMGEQARQQAETHDQPAALAFACYVLANALLGQGKPAQAGVYAEQGRALNEAIGNRWLLSYCHDVLGQIAYAQAELAAAKVHFDIAYAIRAEFEDPGGMALNLRNLGDVAIRREEWAEAHTLYTRSRALYGELGDRGGMVGVERGMAIALVQLGDLAAARQHFKAALTIAVETAVASLILGVLVEIGLYFIQTGNRTQPLGQRVLGFVASHPGCDRPTFDRVRPYLPAAPPSDTLVALQAAIQAELDLPPAPDRYDT